MNPSWIAAQSIFNAEESDGGEWFALRKVVEQHPPIYVDESDPLIKRIQAENRIIITIKNRDLAMDTFIRHHHCQYTVVPLRYERQKVCIEPTEII